MLASVMPGLRDLRAPLSAGFVWIATIVVALGVRTFLEPPPQSLLSDGKLVVSGLGSGASLAALAFAAYLVGLSWQVVWSTTFVRFLALLARVRRIPLTSFKSDGHYIVMSDRTARSFKLVVESKLETLITQQSLDTSESLKVAKEEWARLLKRDLSSLEEWPGNEFTTTFGVPVIPVLQDRAAYDLARLVPARIINDQRETWNAWDRLQGEGEFRALLSVPTVVLAITLACSGSLSWLLLLLLGVVLAYSGFAQTDSAYSYLIEAVRAEKAVLLAGNALPSIHWEVIGNADDGVEVKAHIADPRIA